MSKKDTRRDGELSDEQLDGISGGQQQVVKMGTIHVEAKRPAPEPKVVKMETIHVTAQREKPELAGTKLAQSDADKSRKN